MSFLTWFISVAVTIKTKNEKYIYMQLHTTLSYITLHVSTYYPGRHQVAAHPEAGMFTTANTRRILLYNKNDIHILLYACVCLFIAKSILNKT